MNHDFVNFDDDAYVYGNAQVQSGLTWEGLKWAFLNPVCANWHPVTVLSHMAVGQVCGLKSWGHHLANVLLHALNAALVFALFTRMTGTRWRSLLVAALFAVHPLRVESVAWVAERKDVLSVFFGLLALAFYVRYAEARRQPPEGRGPGSFTHPVSSCRYLLSLCCFALGLLSKPMLVTWPFLMLLLDYWPLGRLQPRRAWRLVMEKIPFFALAAAASVVTFVVQEREGSLGLGEQLPIGARGANALISCCRYLGKLFWPTDLAVYYPHPGHWPLGEVLLAGGVILGISGLCFAQRRRFPFLLLGWLWFCGTLVPVLGLVQVGGQALADRYTYFPSLGVLVLTIWGAHELTGRGRCGVMGLSLAGSTVIVCCMVLTRQQLGYWKDSEALFRHALGVTKNNYPAHLNLGIALGEKGQLDEAIRQFQQALRLKPDAADARITLGIALGQSGQTDEAIRQFEETLRRQPDNAHAHNNLGIALNRKGRVGEAIQHFQEALRLQPDYANARENLHATLAARTDSPQPPGAATKP